MSEKFREVGKVNYEKMTIPEDYRCDSCGAHGVRLWRDYQTIASVTLLLCAHCAEENQKKSNEAGWKSPFSKENGDRIGWFIPAVPIEGRDTYWGYTSVPQSGVNWWKNLPIKN